MAATQKPADIANSKQWAQQLLASNDWPVNDSNVNFLTAWAAAEGGNWNNDYTFNVLNTGQPGFGGTVPSGGSFPAFPTWAQGIAATTYNLVHGYSGDTNAYSSITSALAAGNASQQFSAGNLNSAINTWDPGGSDVTSISTNLGSPPVLSGSSSSGGSSSSAGASTGTGGGFHSRGHLLHHGRLRQLRERGPGSQGEILLLPFQPPCWPLLHRL